MESQAGQKDELTRKTEASELRAENMLLRHQLSLLSRLSYRVASNLNLDTVLTEVVGAACELTEARYGALALLGAAGEFQRLYSYGLRDEDRETLGELPHGRGFLATLHSTNQPMRLTDLSTHELFVGFPEGHPTMKTFLGTNIQARGVVHGILYLAEKMEGRDFSATDEGLLSLFAQQAAAAISNARRFEEERLARTESEAAQQRIIASEARLRDELESLERLRTDLLAAIAHEFRTPLTAIRTAVSVLQDPGLPATRSQERRLLQAISQSSLLMQRLTTDLIDLARFQSGAIRLAITKFDACALAKETTRAMAALFEAKSQSVVFVMPKRIWVHGDRRRLEQALLNLLANAQKFAPQGTSITLKAERLKDQVAWSVTDRGPGVASESLPFLFERFFTLPEGDSGKSNGTGLGLPIAMAIAQAHGGTIDVASVIGKGSTFTLTIDVTGDMELSDE